MEIFGEWLGRQRNERRPSPQIAELIANALEIPAADSFRF